MERKLIVVGDPTAAGGRVLPYSGRDHSMYGHQVALIGGRVYCEGCNSVGIIAKAGGPRRGQFISEVALEGDVVVCHCPAPQPLIATLVHTATYDDMGGGGTITPAMLQPGGLPIDASHIAASKKLVDSAVEHPPEAEQTENICPNMTNKEFCTLVLGLRDDAVRMIERRLKDLHLWGKTERARAREWFGIEDDQTRQYLRNGLSSCRRVLVGLTGDNFVRYSEETMSHVGCTAVRDRSGLIAGVCKPDVVSHTIGINIDFCTLRDRSSELDSQLATLIHEITHFDDTFGSSDDVYKMAQSLSIAKETERALKNADSITGYIAYGASHAG